MEQIHFGEDGVSVSTGNFSRSYVDYSVEAPGFRVNFTRTYNSKDERAAALQTLGRGWTFGFEGSLKEETTNQWIAKLPNGAAEIFLWQTDKYKGHNTRSTLEKQTDGTHILTTKDSYTYGFNSSGYLEWMADRNGNKVTLTLEGSKVKSIKDTVGRIYTVDYTGDLITGITLPATGADNAKLVKLAYKYTNNLLTEVVDPEGHSNFYEYDSKGYLTAIKINKTDTLESVEYVTTAGDNLNKVLNHTVFLGKNKPEDSAEVAKKVTYTYDKANRKTILTDINGRVVEKHFDDQFYLIKSVDTEKKETSIIYNSPSGINQYGEEKKITDRYGNTTEYQRDNFGNITKIINPDGNASTYVYDDKHNLVKETDESGNKKFFIYDDGKNKLIKEAKALFGDEYSPLADQSRFLIREYEYFQAYEEVQLGFSAKGLLKAEIDEEGRRIEYTYDVLGIKTAIKNPKGDVSRFKYNNLGWLIEETTPIGIKTTYDYDLNGKVLKITENSGGEPVVTRKIYNEEGNKVLEVLPGNYHSGRDLLNNAVPANGYTDDGGNKVFHYNKAGLVIKEIDQMGNQTAFEYDIYGNLAKEIFPNNSYMIYEYDVMNRLVKTVFKANDNTDPVLLKEYGYLDGEKGNYKETETVHLSDTLSNTVTKEYNYKGNVVKTTKESGVSSRIIYNPNGSVNHVMGFNGGKTYFMYDGVGRLTETWKEMNPGEYSYSKVDYDRSGKVLGNYTSKDKVSLHIRPSSDRLVAATKEYDKNGNLILIKTSEGSMTRHEYDLDNRMTAKYVYQTEDQVVKTSYEYDYAGRIVKEILHGQAGDIYGNLIDAQREIEIATEFEYDKNGNLVKKKFSNGHKISYDYDKLDRVVKTSELIVNESGAPVPTEQTVEYDTMGNVTKSKAINGRETVNKYDEVGNLVGVLINIPSNPIVSLFEYNRAGQMVREVSPKNFDYPGFDAEGYDPTTFNPGDYDLSKYTRTEYEYDKEGQLLLKKAIVPVENGPAEEIVSEANQYDNSGNLVKSASGENYRTAALTAGAEGSVENKIRLAKGTEFKYNLQNQITLILDLVSKERGLPFKAMVEYDGLSRKVADIDAKGAVTHYYYDDNSNIKTVTRRKSVHEPEKTLKTNVYDLAGHLVETKDGNGNKTFYEYGSFGQVKSTQYPSDDTVEAYTELYQYDVSFNKVYTENLGNKAINEYDDNGRIIKTTTVSKADNKKIVNEVKYDISGNPVLTVDGNGNTSETVYDILGRVVETKAVTSRLDNSESIHRNVYEYDKNGNQVSQSSILSETVTQMVDGNPQTSVVDKVVKKTTYAYDGLNRVLTVTAPDGSVMETKEYDHNHGETKNTDANGHSVSFAYDSNGRLIVTTDQLGNGTSSIYDELGRVKIQVDAEGNKTEYQYDFFGNLKAVINGLGEKTSYTYDLNGNMTSQTDGNGHTILMEYNSRNQVVRRIDHGGRTGVEGKYSYDSRKTVVYSYNGDGTMASMLDRNGVTTEYSYDGFGRLIKTVAGDEVVENAYDSVGNKVTMKDKTGITIRSYDELNRTVVKSVPNAGSTIFEYDLTKVPSSVVSNNFVYTDLEQGQIAERMKDAKGNESFKVFDKNGRLLKVVDLKVETDAQNTVTRTLETTVYAYEPNGNKQSVTYDSGVKESYVYYDNNKLFTLTNFKPDGTTVIDSYEYSYDKAGNMVSKKENLGNNHSDSTTIERITTYKHDALNRLTEVDEPATVQFELVKKTTSYKYDTAGNRIGEYILEGTKLTSKIYKYNEQNRLMSIVEGDIVADTTKTTKYVYDNNGNQLYSMTEALKPVASSGTAKFGMFISGQTVDDNKASLVNTTTVNVYNEFNQLARTVVGSKTVENIYNGEGLRVVKKVDGKATNYVYIYDKIILELDDAGKQTARNLLGSNLISRMIEDGTEYNYLYNGHSDVVALIKPDGTMRMQYYYDAFGVQVHKENYVDNTADVVNPFRYGGYQYDEETESYYLNARMYDPKIARFLQEDTFRGSANDPMSLNLYTYCSNNPLVYWDPSGHAREYMGSTTVSKSKVLKRGSRGEDVAALQRKLGLKADGIFGKNTEQALKNYQKSKGLADDGIAGKNTYNVIYGSNVMTNKAIRDFRTNRKIAEDMGDVTAIVVKPEVKIPFTERNVGRSKGTESLGGNVIPSGIDYQKIPIIEGPDSPIYWGHSPEFAVAMAEGAGEAIVDNGMAMAEAAQSLQLYALKSSYNALKFGWDTIATKGDNIKQIKEAAEQYVDSDLVNGTEKTRGKFVGKVVGNIIFDAVLGYGAAKASKFGRPRNLKTVVSKIDELNEIPKVVGKTPELPLRKIDVQLFGNKTSNTKYINDIKVVEIDGLELTTGPYRKMQNAGLKDAHHIYQDAAMRELQGYSKYEALTVQVQGPANKIGTPHYNATQAQRMNGGGTVNAERKIAYKSLRKSGFTVDQAKYLVREADKYFDYLGHCLDSSTRIPGNRRK